ncbi:MAG TPA: helix-turn-helix domain-containing protein [Dehalococcoidia bacterium]|nr:helix-turn-helix domain-containing protein [Dehalococcoidia bacterium]
MSKNWNLMATHGVVLLHIAANPSATMREMSDTLSMTERRISQVVHDLADANLIEVRRHGRRNSYFINCDARFLHPTLSNIPISRLVAALSDSE